MAEVLSTRTLAIGDSAPSFLLPDAHGTAFSVENVRGPKGLVVAFLCNHCPYVIHLSKELAIFAQTCEAKGIGFVGINSNDVEKYPADSPEKMIEAAKAFGWEFPYLYDETQEVAHAYYAACTPDFYVFDQDLKLTYCGQYDDSRPKRDKPITGKDLKAAVDAVLTGQAPLATQVPSSGCNIKWKSGNEPNYFSIIKK